MVFVGCVVDVCGSLLELQNGGGCCVSCGLLFVGFCMWLMYVVCCVVLVVVRCLVFLGWWLLFAGGC